MGLRLLANVILLVHLGYLVYLTFGGFLAWRWRAMIWPHLVAAGWGVAVIVFEIPCPLTNWENQLRDRAGDATYEGPFIEHYLGDVIYPEEHLDSARWLVLAVVALSWAGVGLQRLRDRQRAER